jgi:hypothetical protein
MNSTRLSIMSLVGLVLALAIMGVAILLANPTASNDEPTPDTLSYHEAFGDERGAPPTGQAHIPLPMAQDPLSGGTMTSAGTSMIEVADSMEAVVPTLLASSDAEVSALGQHWDQDAAALRERGAWMISSATSDAMVHDPDRARQINLQHLLGNGMAMVSEGAAMRAHGEEMITEVDRLRELGVLPDDIADDLIGKAQTLIDAGQRIEEDGEEMQQTAEDLLRSIGR